MAQGQTERSFQAGFGQLRGKGTWNCLKMGPPNWWFPFGIPFKTNPIMVPLFKSRSKGVFSARFVGFLGGFFREFGEMDGNPT